MSERNKHSPLGKLPRPRSPQHLDDKILAHARQRAPQRNVRWRPVWATGIATVSIVAVALLIVQPQHLLPGLQKLPERSIDQGSISGQDGFRGSARFEMPVLQMEKKETRLMPQRSQFDAEPMALPEAGFGPSKAEPLEEPPTDASTLARLAASASIAEPPLWLDQIQLSLRLEHCADILEQGDEAQADMVYQALRQECPRCDLPDTLEQALARLEETAAP